MNDKLRQAFLLRVKQWVAEDYVQHEFVGDSLLILLDCFSFREWNRNEAYNLIRKGKSYFGINLFLFWYEETYYQFLAHIKHIKDVNIDRPYERKS
jgi:hypothetical protein